MQLSAPSLPSDPTASVPTLPGVPTPGPTASSPGTGPDFDALLAKDAPASPTAGKKPAASVTGDALLWSGCLAAALTAPVPNQPAPTVTADPTTSPGITGDEAIDLTDLPGSATTSTQTPATPEGKAGVLRAGKTAVATGFELRRGTFSLPRRTRGVEAAADETAPSTEAPTGDSETKAGASTANASAGTGATSTAAGAFALPIEAAAAEIVAASVPTAPGKPMRPPGRDAVALRAESVAISEEAKIAETTAGKIPVEISGSAGPDKKILTPDNKQFTKHDEPLGTGIANTVAPMHLHSFTAAQATTGSVHAALATTADSTQVTNGPLQVAAQRAVDVVVAASERLEAGTRPAVHLQFAVGDASLSVHVQLRAGEVHATFRTDSPDLRAALATEWQSMSAGATHTVQLADPVFAPATPTQANAGLGDSASQQQRQAHDRHPAETPHPFATVAAYGDDERDEAPAADYRRPSLLSNLGLYTFA